ncbi:hypothetical protein SDC9_199935 [bioreactor metagenome]|uniref:Lipoprotein n=1 Tax=bioreactor metagenome TaxID=1076179 RepID=A0A645IPF2_9ZZZZ
MFKRVIIYIFVCISLVGCSAQNKNSLSASDNISNNSNETSNYTSNTDDVPINIEEVESKVLDVYNKYINKENVNSNKASFICESIRIINGKVYYLVRGFNDTKTNRVTCGWYFVDIYSGDVFDAGPAISDLIPINKK